MRDRDSRRPLVSQMGDEVRYGSRSLLDDGPHRFRRHRWFLEEHSTLEMAFPVEWEEAGAIDGAAIAVIALVHVNKFVDQGGDINGRLLPLRLFSRRVDWPSHLSPVLHREQNFKKNKPSG